MDSWKGLEQDLEQPPFRSTLTLRMTKKKTRKKIIQFKFLIEFVHNSIQVKSTPRRRQPLSDVPCRNRHPINPLNSKIHLVHGVKLLKIPLLMRKMKKISYQVHLNIKLLSLDIFVPPGHIKTQLLSNFTYVLVRLCSYRSIKVSAVLVTRV